MEIYKLLEKMTTEMAKEATGLGIQGVAAAAFLEDENGSDWKLAMGTAGSFKTQTPDGRWFNSACVAFAKLGEAMETRRDSGDAGRELLGCETGFRGGVIEKTGRGYIAAAFSGGSSEDDVEISRNAIKIFKEERDASL